MGHNKQCRGCMYESTCDYISCIKSCIKIEKNVTFKEGYIDGHGQAIENVRYNLLELCKKNGNISVDDINKVCDFCSEIDGDYLTQ